MLNVQGSVAGKKKYCKTDLDMQTQALNVDNCTSNYRGSDRVLKSAKQLHKNQCNSTVTEVSPFVRISSDRESEINSPRDRPTCHDQAVT